MSLTLFSTKNNYYKNGAFWWSRAINRVVGEKYFDVFRVQRRIASMRIYYTRQEFLYQCYVDFNEYAALFGCYPKIDSSHGFPSALNYEAYRDFQENSLNTDGWFGMAIFYIACIYIVHFTYNYMIPYYWIRSSVKNGENHRLRMRDAIATTVLEELYGNHWIEICFTPHDFAYQRRRFMNGFSNPDDPRIMHMATFNRTHKYREHYYGRVGDMNHMSTISFHNLLQEQDLENLNH